MAGWGCPRLSAASTSVMPPAGRGISSSGAADGRLQDTTFVAAGRASMCQRCRCPAGVTGVQGRAQLGHPPGLSFQAGGAQVQMQPVLVVIVIAGAEQEYLDAVAVCRDQAPGTASCPAPSRAPPNPAGQRSDHAQWLWLVRGNRARSAYLHRHFALRHQGVQVQLICASTRPITNPRRPAGCVIVTGPGSGRSCPQQPAPAALHAGNTRLGRQQPLPGEVLYVGEGQRAILPRPGLGVQAVQFSVHVQRHGDLPDHLGVAVL